jgi:hypothetical protein
MDLDAMLIDQKQNSRVQIGLWIELGKWNWRVNWQHFEQVQQRIIHGLALYAARLFTH